MPNNTALNSYTHTRTRSRRSPKQAYGSTSSAQELLEEAEQRALKAGDRTAYHIAWAMRVRTYVAQGAFDLVLSRALNLDADLTRQFKSELTASYSLAVAGAGNYRLGCELADEALRVYGC